MRRRWGIRAIWVCFLARAWFYAAELPVWEGYDEWSHFAVIRRVALRGEILPARDSALPRDVGTSLELAPLPWAWRAAGGAHLTHDQYWRLPPLTREAREINFRVLPRNWQWQDSTGSYRAHEAYQPPLYYWTMAPLMVLLGGGAMARQLLAVRWLGAVLASFAIPFTWRIAREVLCEERLALGCAAIVAVMPGFALTAAHAGNDCLAAGLFALLLWRGVRMAQGDGSTREGLILGAVLGLGLLTKAYFLTAIPAVAVLACWRMRWRAVVPLAVALAVGGWWYGRAYAETGTLTGLTDFMMARDAQQGSEVGQIFGVPWAHAVDSILFSHLYAGGWSFLTVRSWMYHVFYAAILAALVGLARVKRSPALLWLAGAYACFWAGELYHVVILWVSRGVATSMGYYLYAVVAAEVTLCTAGLVRLAKRWPAWVPAAGVALFAALDLYAMHAVSVPYYTGLIRHKANGAMEAFHGAALDGVGLGEIARRIAAFKAPTLSAFLVLVLWAAYLGGTAVLVWGSLGGAVAKSDR